MVARKKKIKARPRTGLAAVDPTKGFVHVLSHFHMDVDKKTLTSICKDWVKKTYNKSDAAAILANPEYHFTAYTHRAATIWYVDQGGQFEENQLSYRDNLKSRFDELISTGKEILKDKKEKAKEKSNVIVLSPQERLRIKINKTVLMELEDLQDSSEDEDVVKSMYTLARPTFSLKTEEEEKEETEVSLDTSDLQLSEPIFKVISSKKKKKKKNRKRRTG